MFDAVQAQTKGAAADSIAGIQKKTMEECIKKLSSISSIQQVMTPPFWMMSVKLTSTFMNKRMDRKCTKTAV